MPVNRIFILLLVGLLCSNPAVNAQQQTDRLLEGKWILEKLLAVKEKTVWTKKPELIFSTKENTVSGYDGCNILMGNITRGPKKALKLHSLTGTLKACPGNSADLFLNTLDQIDHYRIRNGKLELLHGNTILLRLSRK